MKICSKCLLEKPKADFYKTSGNRCKVCHNAACVADVKANPERNRKAAKKWYYSHPENRQYSINNARAWQTRNPERHSLNQFKRCLKVKYNISYEEYSRMSAEQGGTCAICDGINYRRLEVDHDHRTGRIRQLLCGSCNTALGLLKEDPKLFAKAISYLTKHATVKVA